jgi:hypothetical protein
LIGMYVIVATKAIQVHLTRPHQDPSDRLILAPPPSNTPPTATATRILQSAPSPSLLHSSIYQTLLPRFLEGVCCVRCVRYVCMLCVQIFNSVAAARVRDNKKLQNSQATCALQ